VGARIDDMLFDGTNKRRHRHQGIGKMGQAAKSA